MNELHFIFQKTIDIPNPKRTRQSPGVKAASSTSEALFDFLVKSEEAEDEKVLLQLCFHMIRFPTHNNISWI